MGLYHSSGIITDSLVFYHDIYNTVKSYYGAPTVNYISGPSNFGFSPWDFTSFPATVTNDTTQGPSVPGPIPSYVTRANADTIVATAVANSLISQTIATTTTGTGAQICSVYVKYYTGDFFTLNCYYTGDTEVNVNFYPRTGACDAGGTMTYIEDGWYRCSITVPARVNAGTTFNFRIWPGGRGLTNTLGHYFFGAQMESSTFLTPYVVGSRTTTDTVYDMVTRTAGTANNLVYNSDGTYSFNHTSSYINFGNHVNYTQPSTITMSAWIRPESVALDSASCNIMSKNGNLGYRFRFRNPTALPNSIQFIVDGANNILNSPANVCPQGSWSNVAVTGDSTGLKIYVNGALIASNSVAFAPPTPGGGTLLIGDFDATMAEVFSGYIGTTMMHSRALSSYEILHNFNALKGRFGL